MLFQDGEHRIQKRLRIPVACQQRRIHRIRPKLLSGRIERFGHAIGIEKQAIARMQNQMMLRVIDDRVDAQRQAAVEVERCDAVIVNEPGRRMSG